MNPEIWEWCLVHAQTRRNKSHSTRTVHPFFSKAAGNIMPNILAINFYLRSDGGGVFDAVDRMNGQTLCGCTTVTACQAGARLVEVARVFLHLIQL
ncbi:PI-PLC X domain-containing protein At5g67130 [Coffea arabica]|uniref:PI-PLC X domain-containing protein At5g67130 n=1 Tax=Coffea arabica TaxID=13443 RepID=A0A6P6U2Q9_COFAR|nr:PI-PLC X domain-containing protein At5g67130-like [Coffea arabica]